MAQTGCGEFTGPGVFAGTAFIQRVNTAGEKLHQTVPMHQQLGREIQIPYTAEYYFYKPE
jgi:hypothetical protein